MRLVGRHSRVSLLLLLLLRKSEVLTTSTQSQGGWQGLRVYGARADLLHMKRPRGFRYQLVAEVRMLLRWRWARGDPRRLAVVSGRSVLGGDRWPGILRLPAGIQRGCHRG